MKHAISGKSSISSEKVDRSKENDLHFSFVVMNKYDPRRSGSSPVLSPSHSAQ
jgi:hypothetical protein